MKVNSFSFRSVQRGLTTLAPIRVLIVDDHGLVRAGIRALLERHSGIEVVDEASNGRDALRLIRHHEPDIVLLDIAMPAPNGLEVVRQLAKDLSKVRCIILSMHADEEHVWQALQAGAAGYLVKGGSLEELELAIRSVAHGETYLSPGVSGPVIKEYIRRTSPDADSANPDILTPRQREILQMIAEGKSTKQIALLLNVSVKTVESHRAQLMKRLGVQDIASLVRHALRMGLVES
jgi:DNA-binding NarL/FixJ family response regulator